MATRSQWDQDIASLVFVINKGGMLSSAEMNDLMTAYRNGDPNVPKSLVDKAQRQSAPQTTPPPPAVGGSPTPQTTPNQTEYDRITAIMNQHLGPQSSPPPSLPPPTPQTTPNQTEYDRITAIMNQHLGPQSSPPPSLPPPTPQTTPNQTEYDRITAIMNQHLGPQSSPPPSLPPPTPPMMAQGPSSPPPRITAPPPGKDDFYDRLSESFGGRGVMFNRALAANPYYRGVNPWARGVLENQGDPLSAMYALSGNDVGNFRDWTGKREAPFQKGNFDFMGRLQDIQGQGFLPGQGQGWNEWSSGLGDRPNPFQSLLDDDQLGSTIINEMAGAQY